MSLSVTGIPKGPQIMVAGFLFTSMAIVKNKIVFSQWVIVNPETVLCFPARDRYHDGHRERPEGVSGNRIESVAPSGPDQRRYPQARAAACPRTELPDELGGAESGNSAHLRDWPAPAGIYSSILWRNCPRRGPDGSTTGLSCGPFQFRRRSCTRSQRSRRPAGSAGRWTYHRVVPARRMPRYVQAYSTAQSALYFDRPADCSPERLLCGSRQPCYRHPGDPAFNFAGLPPHCSPAWT